MLSRDSELSKYTVEEMLDELAGRCADKAEEISTRDLVIELATRDGVDVTVVDPYEDVRFMVSGPAVVLTVFD